MSRIQWQSIRKSTCPDPSSKTSRDREKAHLHANAYRIELRSPQGISLGASADHDRPPRELGVDQANEPTELPQPKQTVVYCLRDVSAPAEERGDHHGAIPSFD